MEEERRGLIARKDIKPVKIGKWRIKSEDLEGFVKSRMNREEGSSMIGMLDKQTVIETWLSRALEHLHLAFDLADGPWVRYEPFFVYMGLELLCKAYLLAEKFSEFEGLEDQKLKDKVDKIARSFSHGLSAMINELDTHIGDNRIRNVLSQEFDGYTGQQIVKVLESAYTECRYPVPKTVSQRFPINGTDMCWYPLLSSGLAKFGRVIGREALRSIKTRFGVGITSAYIKSVRSKESGERFCRLFFEDKLDEFLT